MRKLKNRALSMNFLYDRENSCFFYLQFIWKDKDSRFISAFGTNTNDCAETTIWIRLTECEKKEVCIWIRKARKAQKTFATGFINAGFLAACLRDGYTYSRDQIYLTKIKWAPIFEPDASALSVIGDGAIKINQAVPGYFDKDNLKELTGIDYSASSSTSNIDDMFKEEIDE